MQLSRLRRIAVCLTMAGLATAADAQQTPREAVARVWETFQTTCKAALFDQTTFISETPNPGPNGISTVARTPDGQIVEARRFADNQMVTLRVTGLPGMRMNMCSAHDQGFNAAEIDMSLSNNPGPWLTAFEEIVRPTSPAPIVGGNLPIGFVARGMAGEYIGQNDTLSHHFSALFEWNGEQVPVTIVVAPYSLVFTALRMEAPE